MSIISEILQKADFQATIKAFIALFMDFNRPWQAGHDRLWQAAEHNVA